MLLRVRFALPSLLTISRIVAAFMLFFQLANQYYAQACLTFIFAGITDFLDGFLARKFNAVSMLGAFLDILADKCIMLSASIGMLWYVPAAPMRWFLYLVLVRELVLLLGGIFLWVSFPGINIESLYVGKVSMTLQFLLMAGMLVSVATHTPMIPGFSVLALFAFCSIIVSLVVYALRFYIVARWSMQRNI